MQRRVKIVLVTCLAFVLVAFAVVAALSSLKYLFPRSSLFICLERIRASGSSMLMSQHRSHQSVQHHLTFVHNAHVEFVKES